MYLYLYLTNFLKKYLYFYFYLHEMKKTVILNTNTFYFKNVFGPNPYKTHTKTQTLTNLGTYKYPNP